MPRTQPRVLRLAPAQCMSAITPKLPASCTSRRTRPAMVVYRHLLRGSPALVACCCLLTYAPPAPPARWRARLLRLLLGSGVGSGRGAQGSALAIRHQSRRSGLLVPHSATWWWQAVVWRRLVGARRSAQLRRRLRPSLRVAARSAALPRDPLVPRKTPYTVGEPTDPEGAPGVILSYFVVSAVGFIARGLRSSRRKRLEYICYPPSGDSLFLGLPQGVSSTSCSRFVSRASSLSGTRPR